MSLQVDSGGRGRDRPVRRHRLLSFDRDPATRGPTVEVAHEALLGSWERLRSGSTKPATSASIDVWPRRPPTGRPRGATCLLPRVATRTVNTEGSTRSLCHGTNRILSASIRQRDEERGGGIKSERERALERRSFLRLRALVAVLAVAALIAAVLTKIAVNRAGEAERRRDEATVAGLTGSVLSHLRTVPNSACCSRSTPST